MEIKSSDLFSKAYRPAFESIIAGNKNRWTLAGGRASAKSSFISLVIVILILSNKNYNAVVIRKTANTLRRSVFEQIVWAINTLGVRHVFKIPKSQTSALPITYTRSDGTVQTIQFAGCDDPEKLKSLKTSEGYNAILWVEEKTELNQTELQNIKISVLRGGDKFYMFESYNPPSAIRHWCNEEIREDDPLRMAVFTTYKDVKQEWLGSMILHDIEMMKQNNPMAYQNIYMGIPTGSGRNVFSNIETRKITQEEIEEMEDAQHGVDWGYYPDPYVYCRVSFNARTQTLYILDELYIWRAQVFDLFCETRDFMKKTGHDIETTRITADREKLHVLDFRSWGADMRMAIKGVNSRTPSFRWLQGLKKIVIDPERTPKALDEFSRYEYAIDKKTGDVLIGYPDGQPDHFIDATRYATEHIWRQAGE